MKLKNNNFEISLVGFMPNITTNHAITYTFTNQSLAHENYFIKSFRNIKYMLNSEKQLPIDFMYYICI